MKLSRSYKKKGVSWVNSLLQYEGIACADFTQWPDISTELALSYFIGNSEEREGRREFIGWEKEAKKLSKKISNPNIIL